MLIQDRIRTIMKSGNLNSSEFADKIGVKRSNLSHVLSGRNKPSFDFLVKIISNYPNVNASWLITGETRGEQPVNSSEKTVLSNPDTKSEKNVLTAREGRENSKSVSKIVIFYEDGTFDTYNPNQQ